MNKLTKKRKERERWKSDPVVNTSAKTGGYIPNKRQTVKTKKHSISPRYHTSLSKHHYPQRVYTSSILARTDRPTKSIISSHITTQAQHGEYFTHHSREYKWTHKINNFFTHYPLFSRNINHSLPVSPPKKLSFLCISLRTFLILPSSL